MDLLKLILVLACMAPLFILMAIRGLGTVPWEIYFPAFLGMAILPNLYLVLRIFIAKNRKDRKLITVSSTTDNKEQIITYIFAMLLPLFQASVTTEQDLYAALCALLFVILIFGYMELYYVNLAFSFFGYRIISLKPDATSASLVEHVLITKRRNLPVGLEIQPIRVTDFLLFDK